LLQVHQAVTVARADEQIARAKGAQLVAQISENVERLYFALLIAQRRQIIAEKKIEVLDGNSSSGKHGSDDGKKRDRTRCRLRRSKQTAGRGKQ